MDTILILRIHASTATHQNSDEYLMLLSNKSSELIRQRRSVNWQRTLQTARSQKEKKGSVIPGGFRGMLKDGYKLGFLDLI